MLLPITSTVIASLNPLACGGNANGSVGIGPAISQFPASGLTGVLPPPQPQSSKLIPQAVKLNQAQFFI
jgi:hypothetical protein